VTNRETDDISRKNLAMRNTGAAMQSVLASASLGQPLDSPKASFGLPHGYLRAKGGTFVGVSVVGGSNNSVTSASCSLASASLGQPRDNPKASFGLSRGSW
jgi:hypothetical protein